jgi:hypothetical protein
MSISPCAGQSSTPYDQYAGHKEHPKGMASKSAIKRPPLYFFVVVMRMLELKDGGLSCAESLQKFTDDTHDFRRVFSGRSVLLSTDRTAAPFGRTKAIPSLRPVSCDTYSTRPLVRSGRVYALHLLGQKVRTGPKRGHKGQAMTRTHASSKKSWPVYWSISWYRFPVVTV